MKQLIFTCILLISAQGAMAQVDTLRKGDDFVVVHPILHGALALEWEGKTIYVDPYGGKKGFEALSAPDLILITDIHGDHLDSATLAAVHTAETQFIVPKAVAERLGEAYKNVKVLANGAKAKWGGARIEGVPMYNLPESAESRHTKGRGNGYLLNLGELRIYISGDTEDIAEMRALEDIDAAFVCMNLPYTMDVNQAADAVAAFKPAIVYPYHFRGKDGLADIEQFEELVLEDFGLEGQVEVRIRKWYPGQ